MIIGKKSRPGTISIPIRSWRLLFPTKAFGHMLLQPQKAAIDRLGGRDFEGISPSDIPQDC